MSDDDAAPEPQAEPAGPPSASPGRHDAADDATAPDTAERPYRPSYLFLGVVSVTSLVLDLATKEWATRKLVEGRVKVIEDHLWLTLAKNPGGAWGLLQGESESIRKPFFLLISLVAVVFIFSLYRRLAPAQTALKWGLPLVLGGALGNLVDRVRYGHVIDFIDFRADWVRSLNQLIGKLSGDRGGASDHWPTFNVADIAICVGVALMAVDMFQSRKPSSAATAGDGGGGAPPAGGRSSVSDDDAGGARDERAASESAGEGGAARSER